MASNIMNNHTTIHASPLIIMHLKNTLIHFSRPAFKPFLLTGCLPGICTSMQPVNGNCKAQCCHLWDKFESKMHENAS